MKLPVLSIEIKQVLVPPDGSVIKQPQLPGLRIDRKRTYVRRMVQRRSQRVRVFDYGVEEFVVRMNHQKGRIDDLGCQLRLAQLSGSRVETSNINTLAVALAQSLRLVVPHILEPRIRTGINEVLVALRRSRTNCEHSEAKNNSYTAHRSDAFHQFPGLLL